MSRSKRGYALRELFALVLVLCIALSADGWAVWWHPVAIIGICCALLAVGAWYQGFTVPRGGHQVKRGE